MTSFSRYEGQLHEPDAEIDDDLGSHFHPCSECGEPYECWCAWPEFTPVDSLARCDDCKTA